MSKSTGVSNRSLRMDSVQAIRFQKAGTKPLRKWPKNRAFGWRDKHVAVSAGRSVGPDDKS